MADRRHMHDPRVSGVSAEYGHWWGAGALFLVALAVRLVHFGHTPTYDEFYHLLAAHSWLEYHTLSISGGVYTRAAPFTILVAEFFRLFGENLIVARIPALLAGALLVPVVFLWVRSVSGARAACATAILITVSPLLISLSQMVRFYTLQALCFFLAAIAVYALVTRRVCGVRAVLYAVGGAAALGFALDLQITTAIGAVGLIAWSTAVGLRALPSLAARRRKLVVAALFVLLIALGITAWIGSARLAALWHTFRVPPYWEAGVENNYRYYFYWFMGRYPTLWSLFPLAIFWGLVWRPRPVLFATMVFVVALAVHTVAGPKQGRYIVYAMPFFFVVWGIAIGEAVPVMLTLVRGATRTLLGERLRSGAEQWLVRGGLIAILGFAAASNPAFPLAYRMLTRTDANWTGTSNYRGHADWTAMVPYIKPMLKNVDVVLTAEGVKALYYLGRYDFEINLSNLRDTKSGREFSINLRTGHRVVGDLRAVQLIMACYPTGLVVVEVWAWEWAPRIVPPDVAAYVEAHARRVALPSRSRMLAFEWRHAPEADAAACRELR